MPDTPTHGQVAYAASERRLRQSPWRHRYGETL